MSRFSYVFQNKLFIIYYLFWSVLSIFVHFKAFFFFFFETFSSIQGFKNRDVCVLQRILHSSVLSSACVRMSRVGSCLSFDISYVTFLTAKPDCSSEQQQSSPSSTPKYLVCKLLGVDCPKRESKEEVNCSSLKKEKAFQILHLKSV